MENQNIRTPFVNQGNTMPGIRNPEQNQMPDVETSEQNRIPEGSVLGQKQIPENEKDIIKKLREKYKAAGKKVYEIGTSFSEDDETEKKYNFIFQRPNTASYDRYVKTSATSGSKALKMFLLDNICPEQEEELSEALEEYPAMSIGIGEKLLGMLGLSKETQVKKL